MVKKNNSNINNNKNGTRNFDLERLIGLQQSVKSNTL